MSISTATLTGTLYKPDGTAFVSATVRAQLLQTTEEAAINGVSDTTSTATHASTGAFTLTLNRNTVTVPSQYLITLPDGKFFYMTVGPNTATYAVGDLVSGTVPVKYSQRNITDYVCQKLYAESGQCPGVTVATTGNTDSLYVCNKAGVLASADFTSIDALSASDTNYITFSITNMGQSGGGSTAMLAATNANTTKSTGGTALTAFAKRSLTLHGTAGNLVVAVGDVLRVRFAVSGTLGATVTGSTARLRFSA